MAYTFKCTQPGYFNSMILDLIYEYCSLQNQKKGEIYMDLTLCNKDNNLVVFTNIKNVKFQNTLDEYGLLPIKIIVIIENNKLYFTRMENSVYVVVENYNRDRPNMIPKVFIPTIITINL